MIKKGKTFISVLFLAVFISLIIIYNKFNPENTNIFPKCPFKLLTGFDCAGCGSQRALHHFLNVEIGSAFKANALLVLSIPYLLFGYFFEIFKPQNINLLRIRNALYGKKAIWIVLGIIIMGTSKN